MERENAPKCNNQREKRLQDLLFDRIGLSDSRLSCSSHNFSFLRGWKMQLNCARQTKRIHKHSQPSSHGASWPHISLPISTRPWVCDNYTSVDPKHFTVSKCRLKPVILIFWIFFLDAATPTTPDLPHEGQWETTGDKTTSEPKKAATPTKPTPHIKEDNRRQWAAHLHRYN